MNRLTHPLLSSFVVITTILAVTALFVACGPL